MPPEGLEGRCGASSSVTFSYDIRPMGSLIFFMMSGGAHAFPVLITIATIESSREITLESFQLPPTLAPWRRERRST